MSTLQNYRSAVPHDGRTEISRLPSERRVIRTGTRSDAPLEGLPLSTDVPTTSVERYALFVEFQPLVQRLIRQYGDDAELREDLVGEIYFRFCAILDAYDPSRGIPLRPYIVHQLGYSVYSYARQNWRRHRREISLEIDSIAKTLPSVDDISTRWDDALMMQKVQENLPGAMSQLSARQRQVLVWRYFEARSFEEIADRLNVQLATARSTLRHALKNMKRKLIEDNCVYE